MSQRHRPKVRFLAGLALLISATSQAEIKEIPIDELGQTYVDESTILVTPAQLRRAQESQTRIPLEVYQAIGEGEDTQLKRNQSLANQANQQSTQSSETIVRLNYDQTDNQQLQWQASQLNGSPLVPEYQSEAQQARQEFAEEQLRALGQMPESGDLFDLSFIPLSNADGVSLIPNPLPPNVNLTGQGNAAVISVPNTGNINPIQFTFGNLIEVNVTDQDVNLILNPPNQP